MKIRKGLAVMSCAALLLVPAGACAKAASRGVAIGAAAMPRTCSVHAASASSDEIGLPSGPVATEGRWLVDARGRVLLLHGLNQFGQEAPCVLGIGGPDTRWMSDYYTDMVVAVARHFLHDPWVVGYEIMNEPWPGDGWRSCMGSGGCPSLEASELQPFYSKVAEALRKIDDRHIVVMEPFITVGEGLGISDLPPPSGNSNVALAFHQYALTPAGEPALIAGAVGWAARHRGAVVNTEWSDWLDTSIARQAGEFDAALVPWAFWQFANCEGGCAPGDANALDSLVYDPALPPTGSNLNSDAVNALVRAYPVAIAGTPTGVVFDPASRTLSATWSTSAASGKHRIFASGAESVFSTPRLVYPQGYTVRVRGARVISTPCAAYTVLSQVGSPHAVSVTITPGGACR